MVYLKLADGLQTNVFHTHFTGIGVLDGADVYQTARLAFGLVVTLASGIYLAVGPDLFPELVYVAADLLAVPSSRVGGKSVGCPGMLALCSIR